MAKLLIIDDDRETVVYLKGFFKTRGCHILASFTGEDGLVSFEKDKPDVVLLDIKLPGINGLEVLKRIRENDKQTPVVMFTALGDESTRKEAQDLGANNYIKKPFNMLELEGVVAKLIYK
ncbi:MAG: response regulator [Candidatus Omnitrophota bacterium]|jgi:two-component system response regulator (stage 0 sporulation protein F)|nr:MAG: response regulator [Candidatus Omnitrophota bacterium]